LARLRGGRSCADGARGRLQRYLSLWTPFLRCGGEWVRYCRLCVLLGPAKRTAGPRERQRCFFVSIIGGAWKIHAPLCFFVRDYASALIFFS